MSRVLGGSAWLLLLGAGCALKPIDPWRCGAWALDRCDLDGALAAFDAVPLHHLRYPESRAAALAVQRTMRHCDELLRDALQLRSEGRDAEALAVLHRVRALWVAAPGLQDLLADTERRQRLARTPLPNAPAPVAAPQPSAATEARVALPVLPRPVEPAEPQPATPQPEVVAAAAASAEIAVAPPPPAELRAEPSVAPPVPQPARSAVGSDAITAAMIGLEAKLLRGERDDVIAQMADLALQYPDDLRVRVRATRLLHQRALVRYGDGQIDGAIRDWRHVLELDPSHATAATLLQAVELEAQQIGRAIR